MTFLDFADKKSVTFSLSYSPDSFVGGYIEPHLSEKPNVEKTHDTMVKSRIYSSTEDVNAPLCPLLPACKANKDNKLKIWIAQEQKTLTGGTSKSEGGVPIKKIDWEKAFK